MHSFPASPDEPTDDDASDVGSDVGSDDQPEGKGKESGKKGKQLPAKTGRRSVSRKKDDLLAAYLAEVRQYPLLEVEEERELAIHYAETGDPDAAHRLVTANLRLVVKLAFQYHRQ